jgi:hypothetical protein
MATQSYWSGKRVTGTLRAKKLSISYEVQLIETPHATERFTQVISIGSDQCSGTAWPSEVVERARRSARGITCLPPSVMQSQSS